MERKSIKIAHVVGKRLGGGVESVLMNYYRNIDRQNIQFVFICDNDSTDIPYKEITSLGGEVILVPGYQHIFAYIKKIKTIFKKGNFDIVHSHINTLSVFSLYAAKKAKIKIRIAHSHSTTNNKEIIKNFIKIILRPFIGLVATDFFACTEYAGKWMFGKRRVEKGLVKIINNGIETDKFKFNPLKRNDIRNNLKIPNDSLVFGNVGRFVEQKNQLFLIDLFKILHKQYPKSYLLFIGKGPNKTKLMSKVLEYKLDNNVIFLGQVNDPSPYYSAMDCFLFPSLYEGLGMVMVEAQCSNLTCLASSFVPVESKVNSNVFYLPLNLDIWIDTIKKINFKQDRNYYNNLINLNFDIKNEANKLCDLYQQIADAKLK